ncbi:MAG: chloride channel protein [Bacteroidaceae bacterium]|jgi:CIC family chloride channel protein|nr:chloride channel protein [Bacteroidaceae bacterium]
MNVTGIRRKEIRLINFITEWIKGDHTEKQIVLMISLMVGVCTGLTAFVLKSLIEEIKHLLTSEFAAEDTNLLYLVFPAVGILLSLLFVNYIVRADISHGVTKILYAMSRGRSRIKSHNRWSSIIASAITIGFGGSVGAEAPIVLTGAAWGSDFGKRFHLPPKTLMLLVGCGAAGAVSGVFKAPIAGLVFVLEVLMLDLSFSSLLPLMVTSITSVCVSYAFYGTAPQFDFNLSKAFSIDIIPGCILLGVACGLVSLYFTRTMNWLEGIFGRIKRKRHKFLLGAIVLGVLIYFFPAMYGEGYDVINQLINNVPAKEIMHNTLFYGKDSNLLIYLGLVLIFKVFATTATNGGGGCGGVFAPSLFLGCIAGFLFAHLWDWGFRLDVGSTCYVSPKNCGLYGMAGLMSGVMHAPLTGIFLIAELTGGYDLFVPLMIVSVISYLTINLFEPHSIYAMRLARRGQLITHNKDSAILTLLSLESLIEKNFKTVTPDMPLRQFIVTISQSHRNLFPVVDANGRLLGVVPLDAVRLYMFRPELYHQYKVSNFMVEPPAVLMVNDPLSVVTQKFEETKTWNLPVVDENRQYIGFISRSGLFNSYRETLIKFSEE